MLAWSGWRVEKTGDHHSRQTHNHPLFYPQPLLHFLVFVTMTTEVPWPQGLLTVTVIQTVMWNVFLNPTKPCNQDDRCPGCHHLQDALNRNCVGAAVQKIFTFCVCGHSVFNFKEIAQNNNNNTEPF